MIVQVVMSHIVEFRFGGRRSFVCNHGPLVCVFCCGFQNISTTNVTICYRGFKMIIYNHVIKMTLVQNSNFENEIR